MNRRILILSIFFFILSLLLQNYPSFGKENYTLAYEYINIKDIARTSIYEKKDSSDEKKESTSFIGVLFEKTKNSKIPPKTVVEKVVNAWHLPTEMGIVTQNPSYYHAAYDITSPRGTSEIIFPVANGTISGIYIDNAGGLTITILHNINGIKYTSQYVHMWRYADGLYVGKAVTINDALGWMGSTGYSTGTHLHLAIADCALFDPNDSKCPDLNSFSRYTKSLVANGHWGLGSYILVPVRWNSR